MTTPVNILTVAPLTDVEVIDLGIADLSVSTIDDFGNEFFQIIAGGIGTNGDGIREIIKHESNEDGGANIITFVLASGKQVSVAIHNGSQGDPGEPGTPGRDADIEGANKAIEEANKSATEADKAAEAAKHSAENAQKAIAKINEAAEQVSNINAELEGDTLAVTNRNGETKRVNVKGPKGDPGEVKMVLMEQTELDSLKAKDCIEGFLYLGLGEILDTDTEGNAFRFGGKFPIVFGSGSGGSFRFGGKFPIKFQS